MARRVNEFDKKVGIRLKELRVYNGKSQTEIGKAIGVSFQQIQKYERGLNRVSAGRLSELAAYFGITINEFLSGLDKGDSAKSIDHVSEPELRFIYNLRQVDPVTRNAIMSLVSACAKANSNDEEDDFKQASDQLAQSG